jgi:superfamily II DNA/RNA helicase
MLVCFLGSRLLQLLDDFLGSSSRGLTDDDIDVAVQETAHLDAEQAVSEIDLEEPSVEIQGVAEAECHRVIVFVLFKQEAKTLSRLLISKGVDAVALHGDLSQTQRSAAINAFRSGDARVLGTQTILLSIRCLLKIS